jgi:hypothetical protein
MKAAYDFRNLRARLNAMLCLTPKLGLQEAKRRQQTS